MYNERKFSDFKILFKNEEVNCHKNVLESGSRYFENKFSKSDEDFMYINEEEEEDMKIYLNFLYSGRFEGNENIEIYKFLTVLHKVR
jgi:hypothetical protein